MQWGAGYSTAVLCMAFSLAVGSVLVALAARGESAGTAGKAASSAVSSPVKAGEVELRGRVVGIADGDTLSLLVVLVPGDPAGAQAEAAGESGPRPQSIRLAQIDAPEKSQPWGRAARQALADFSFGAQARVVVVDRDRYGRAVGEVFVGALHVNEEMVRRGHAWAYTRYSRSTRILELEDQARAAGLGLWALPLEQREPPWLWRGQQNRSHGEGGATSPPAPDPAAFACGGARTCQQMTSCEEARFQLLQCGATGLDGDGDGTPCESLCAP
jgi:endonuclease YncB( thermonuclease family)